MQKSIAKNIFYKVTLNFFNLVLPVIVGPYVYRTLGATSVGMVSYSESMFNYFFIFAVFGVHQYGLREVSRVKDDKEKVSQLFTSLFSVTFVMSIATSLIFFVFAYVGFGDKQIFPVLLIFGISLFINMFYVDWVNEAFENYDFITIKTIIVRLVYVSLLFTLVHNSHDYKQFAFLLMLSTFLNNIFSFFYIKRKVKFNFKKISIREHIRPLFLVVIFSNANILYTQLDRVMLGKYINTAAVSYYVMAQQIMGIINSLILSVIQVTIPRLSYLSGNDDEHSYITLLNTISKVYFAALFPASIGMLIISDIGVVIYGGKEFAAAGPVLAVFSFYMVSVGIESILANQIIYVKRRENTLVKLIFICGFINFGFNFILLKLGIFSSASAIFTTAISNYLLLTLEYIFIRKYIKVKYKLFELSKLKYLFYSLLFIPISYGIRLFITNTIYLFFTLIIVNAVVYATILFITKDEVLEMFLIKLKLKKA
ncbi:oligosaccharide flippase family protein [Bacillus salipaludis]|uniref:Oligosaccharide flippase family protein n=1 Tax=Bacillus salipaludis TaxID=2547811 RepID=A0ABW8R9W2_9BACI